ncbi:unnamed protein product [Thlaspi arvense]|uniref:Uncharacterized protein n=1 Tax=Thlaspi arvense TaxID=13288 RepID=A0AAU9RQX3_THLAR|nr:unnamed protein product [Thlaspi arvense]
MTDIISGIFSKCFEPAWSFLTAESGYICKFEDNLEELENALGGLKAKRDDVLSRVNGEERKGGIRLAVVARWLSKVETIETETNQLVAEASPLAERLSTQCFCNLQIISAYSCRKKISKKMIEVRNLSFEEWYTVFAEGGKKEQIRQEANSSMIYARGIDLSHSEKPKNWTWSLISEPPNEVSIEVAILNEVYWLDIRGTYTRKLTPETNYEVVFMVKLEKTASGWRKPVNLSLELVMRDKREFWQEKTLCLQDYISDEWVDIIVGDFVAPPMNASAEILFNMYQYDDTVRKTGLVVKGVAIRAAVN